MRQVASRRYEPSKPTTTRSPSSSSRPRSARAAHSAGPTQVDSVSPDAAVELQHLGVRELRVVRLPAQKRLGDPARRIGKRHRLHVVRVGRGRRVLPDERPGVAHPADRQPRLALDVVRVERSVQNPAQERVVPEGGFPGGRDREHLRRRTSPTARRQRRIGSPQIWRRPLRQLIHDDVRRVIPVQTGRVRREPVDDAHPVLSDDLADVLAHAQEHGRAPRSGARSARRRRTAGPPPCPRVRRAGSPVSRQT